MALEFQRVPDIDSMALDGFRGLSGTEKNFVHVGFGMVSSGQQCYHRA